MDVTHNGAFPSSTGTSLLDTSEPVATEAATTETTAPLDTVDRPTSDDDTGDIDTLELDFTDLGGVDESTVKTNDTPGGSTDFAEQARQDIPSGAVSPFGERLFPAVYVMSICIGILGQILGFGALFGGQPRHYVAAVIVGAGFELIMISFGDRALAMRKREYRVHQWFPFMFFSNIAAGVAAFMNGMHWWDFDPGHTLAMIFAGVAVLGYLGHMVNSFVAGTQHLKDVERKRRIRARELAEQHHAAEKARIAAAHEQQRRQRAEQAEREAEELRENLPRPQRKGQRIEQAQAVHIGKAMGATTPAALKTAIAAVEHPKFGRWTLPGSDTTFKKWATKIRNDLNGTT